MEVHANFEEEVMEEVEEVEEEACPVLEEGGGRGEWCAWLWRRERRSSVPPSGRRRRRRTVPQRRRKSGAR